MTQWVIVVVVLILIWYFFIRKTRKNKTLTLFYMNGCPACVGFKKTWKELESIYNTESYEINSPEGQELRKTYEFKTVPSLWCDGEMYPSTDRTVAKINKWVDSL